MKNPHGFFEEGIGQKTMFVHTGGEGSKTELGSQEQNRVPYHIIEIAESYENQGNVSEIYFRI